MVRSLLLFSMLTSVAAADPCEPYTHQAWRSHMSTADQALTALDRVSASETLDLVRDRLRCLDGVVRPDHLARYARQVALLLYFNQDADSAQRWAALSVAAEPELPWPDSVAPGHPFRDLVDGVELGTPAGPDGQFFVTPKKGSVFYNGDVAPLPVAYPETPGLWQMTDKKGNLVNAWWQDGSAFPESILSSDGRAAAIPKDWEGPPAMDARLVASQLTFDVPERAPLVVEEPEPEPEPEPDSEATDWPEDELDFEYDDDEPVDDATPENGLSEDPQ